MDHFENPYFECFHKGGVEKILSRKSSKIDFEQVYVVKHLIHKDEKKTKDDKDEDYSTLKDVDRL